MDQNDQAQVIEESDADLEAGFAAVRGGEQPAPQTQPDPKASEASAAGDSSTTNPETEASAQPDQGISNVERSTETVEPERKEPTTAELMAQIAALNNSVRNIAGNFGGLKSEVLRELNKLSQVRAAEPQGSAAARGAEKAQQLLLKRVRESWPDLADDLAADLAESISAAPAAPTVDPTQIERLVEQRVSQRVQEVEQRVASETLEMSMPNWQQEIATRDTAGNIVKDSTGKIIPSREFMSWLESKGPDYVNTFWGTNSARFLVGTINGFKEHQKQAQQARNTKQDRLKSAVVPVGRGSTVMQPEIDEEAAMVSGWNEVRGAALR